MKKSLILCLCFSLFLSSPAMAEDIWQMAESDQYGKKAGGMFMRGLVNAASCFVDLAVQTVEKTQDGPPLVGTLTGIGSGAGCTVLRAASGVIDVASFWVPDFNGLPVARSYSNCLLDGESSSYRYSSDYVAASADYDMPQASAKSPSLNIDSGGKSQHDASKYIKK